MYKLAAVAVTFMSVATAGTNAHAGFGGGPGGGDNYCPPALNEWKSVKWDNSPQSSGGKSWGVGFDVGAHLRADCHAFTATATADVRADVLGITAKPVEISITGATRKDHSNTIDYKVLAFGFTVKKETIVNYSHAISGAVDVGWMLPDPNNKHEPIAGDWSTSYGFPVIGDCGVHFQYSVVADLGAYVIWNVGSTEVSAHTLAAANLNASLTASITHDGNEVAGTSGSMSIARVNQGGQASLKQDVGLNWKASADNFISISKLLQAKLEALGTTFFELTATPSFSDGFHYETTFSSQGTFPKG